MSFKSSIDLHDYKFATLAPNRRNAFNIYKSNWKYGYDEMSFAEIYGSVMRDPRPRWCAEEFPNFNRLHIVEIGPADGYHTAGLEFCGARNVTAIEGNVDAFLRCIILKNYLGLQSEFVLGDFVELFQNKTDHPGRVAAKADLIYASGMLYHLRDPLYFLHEVSKIAPHLYLWTHFFDAEAASRIQHEREGFAAAEQQRVTVGGASATYYRKYYNTDHVSAVGYIGGLHPFASWISRDDLFSALEVYGYRIRRVVEDPASDGMMPAVNILASQQ
jgi:hypothetical protein